MSDEYQKQFSANEKVMHKLFGAAYQMTFGQDADYGRAVVVAMQAIDYYREHPDAFDGDVDAVPHQGSTVDTAALAQELAAEIRTLDTTDGTADGETTDRASACDGGTATDTDFTLPGKETKARQAVFALVRAMEHELDWLTPCEVQERTDIPTNLRSNISTVAANYADIVASRARNGNTNEQEYRVHSHVYNELQDWPRAPLEGRS